MSTYLRAPQSENHDAREKKGPFLSGHAGVIIAGNMVCFLVENKGSAGVKKLNEKGSMKQTRSYNKRKTYPNFIKFQGRIIWHQQWLQ